MCMFKPLYQIGAIGVCVLSCAESDQSLIVHEDTERVTAGY